MRASTVVVGLTLLAARSALAYLDPELEKPVGWTEDSAFFITELAGSPSAIDARTGQRTEFHTGKAFEAWTDQHPRAEAGPESGAVAPGGAVKLECHGATTNEAGQFVAAKQGKDFDCTLVRGSTPLPLRRRTFSGSLKVFWSPDGRRIAWHYFERNCTPSNGADLACDYVNDLVIERTVGPRLSVVASTDDAARLKRALDALEKAGFVPTQVGPAKKARDTTAVYAAKGMEADAKRVAAVFGAKVEPLSWKSDADVVVALGK